MGLPLNILLRAIAAAPHPSPPGIFLQQTFTGAPGAALTALTPTVGGAWGIPFGGTTPGSPSAIDTAGTALYSPTSSGSYVNAALPATADYYVEAVLAYRAANGDATGVYGRQSASANTGYFARYNQTGGAVQLYKVVAGAATQLGSVATTFSSGTLTLRLTMTGSTISASANGATLISVTDTDIAGAGQAGIRQSVAQSGTTGIHIASIVAST